MDPNELIRSAIWHQKINQGDICLKMGWTQSKLSHKLRNGYFTINEFAKIMEILGVEITFRYKDTGEDVKIRRKGAGRRVRAMVNKVIYDTAISEAVSNNFWSDGEHELPGGIGMELYVTRDGKYFLAEYLDMELTKDRIIPVTEGRAREFIEKYGTDIHRGPTE